MEKVTFTIKGTAPMLMHNGQLADPTNEHSKALSKAVSEAKSKKTDAAHLAVKRAEFMGSLYLDENLEPTVPGETLEALLQAGARKSKKGKEVSAGVIIDGNFPLKYKGPRTPDELWDKGFYKTASAKVGKNRVMRTRPMFTGWSVTFDIHYNPSLINKQSLRDFLITAGAECGYGDWRPRYGRFEVA